MNLVQLQAAIIAKFPKVWIKEGSLFSNDHCESLWTGEGSFIDMPINIPGEPPEMFPMDAFDMYPDYAAQSLYVFGVHRDLYEFLAEHGYHAEAHDGGTFFIWKS